MVIWSWRGLVYQSLYSKSFWYYSLYWFYSDMAKSLLHYVLSGCGLYSRLPRRPAIGVVNVTRSAVPGYPGTRTHA